jgi:hypothetical protein
MSVISTLESEWDRVVAELKKIFEKGVAAEPPGATGPTGPAGVSGAVGSSAPVPRLG